MWYLWDLIFRPFLFVPFWIRRSSFRTLELDEVGASEGGVDEILGFISCWAAQDLLIQWCFSMFLGWVDWLRWERQRNWSHRNFPMHLGLTFETQHWFWWILHWLHDRYESLPNENGSSQWDDRHFRIFLQMPWTSLIFWPGRVKLCNTTGAWWRGTPYLLPGIYHDLWLASGVTKNYSWWWWWWLLRWWLLLLLLFSLLSLSRSLSLPSSKLL